MPTGYTCIIEDNNATFKQYAMRCAEAFFPEGELPKSKPGTYHRAELKKQRNKLKKYLMMTLRQWKIDAHKTYLYWVKHNKEIYEANEEETSRYKKMLEKVKGWHPPTPDHKNIKKFMIDQIDLCITPNYYKIELREEENCKAYRKRLIDGAKKDIAYHEKGLARDIKRFEDDRKWIQKLRSSL